jgi:AcrR family transcriptional regulator
MATRRGWGGDPPVDDDEARRRIIEAAMRCLDRKGPEAFSLSDVAADLGVIRQTVYRYFDSTDALFIAVSEAAVLSFIDRVDEQLRGITDPAEWAVQCVAAGIEILPSQPYLTLFLDVGKTATFSRSFASDDAMTISRELFKRADVDWSAHGFEEEDVIELERYMLRLLLSFVLAPAEPAQSGDELRRYLRRWLGPAVQGRP